MISAAQLASPPHDGSCEQLDMGNTSDSTDSGSEASNAHKMFSLFYGWKRPPRFPSSSPPRRRIEFKTDAVPLVCPDALAAHQAAFHEPAEDAEQEGLTFASSAAQPASPPHDGSCEPFDHQASFATLGDLRHWMDTLSEADKISSPVCRIREALNVLERSFQ